MGKIIITIILVNIEMAIIQRFIFEFENMMYVSLKKHLATETFHLKKNSNLN